MKKSLLRIVLVAAVLIGLAYWWFASRDAQKTAQSESPVPAAAPGAPAAAPTLPLTAPLEQAAAPGVGQGGAAIPAQAQASAPAPDPLALPVPSEPGEADDLFVSTLSDLVTRKSLKEFFQVDALARRVVATTDCLPRVHCSWTVWPVNRTPGRFSVVPTADGTGGTLSVSNSARYSAFIQFVDSIDTPKWITLYRQVYPMLQKAFVDLGYPNESFHDRLLQVIDHLLAAPVMSKAPLLQLVEVRGPIASLQPWVRYEYADPALEALSAGQKILIRLGAAHHQQVRIKLTSARAALTVLGRPGLPARAP